MTLLTCVSLIAAPRFVELSLLEPLGGLGGDAARRGADIAGSGHDLLDDAAVFNLEGGVVPGSGLKRLALLARHLSFFSGGTSFHGISTFARRWLASSREACLW